jgi:hypothetical protein
MKRIKTDDWRKGNKNRNKREEIKRLVRKNVKERR